MAGQIELPGEDWLVGRASRATGTVLDVAPGADAWNVWLYARPRMRSSSRRPVGARFPRGVWLPALRFFSLDWWATRK